jgi:hypothetical protein
LARLAGALLIAALLVGCGGGDDGDQSVQPVLVGDIRPAIEAVEAELGGSQEFFEVNATAQLVNLFVSVDGGSSAVPYVFFDGELQSPAPALSVESGFTFSADAIDFDEDTVLDAVAAELPVSTIDGFAIEGGEGGIVRYLVSTVSEQGGVLAVTVAADGTVLEVDPV